MAIATCVVLLVPSAWGQVGVIAIAGIAGRLLFKPAKVVEHDPLPITVSHRAGVLWLSLFFVLLIGLPVLAELMPSQTMAMVDSFYRVGSLVFGGGHVVLPLLQAEVVPSGWVNNESFLAGYGAAQAVPGPLFTFAAFLGASMNTAPSGWIGGIVCLCWLSSRPRSCWSSDQCHFGSVCAAIQASSCAGRDQCRCSRLAAGRAVSACMD